jgi:hypothetical protein
MTRTQWAIRHQTIRQQVLGGNTDTDYSLYLQGKSCFPKPHANQPVPTRPPKFRQSQMVCFQGGTGRVRRCHLKSGTWAYAVEMALGPEPESGRVGSETTILLNETDMQALMN